MADNVTLDTMTGGDTIRADDDGTAKWQYVKLAFGADNTQSIVSSTTVNPLPVVTPDPGTTATDLAKAVSGAAGNSDVGIASLAVRDDTLTTLTPIDGDYTQFRVNSQGALWTVQSGNITETNSAAILADTASIDTNMATVAGAVTASKMQTDIITSALPTGAATEATLATVETNTDFGTVTGGGVEATALRVTLASDSTGQITVDGTVTANAGTGTWTVDGSGVTQPVSAASLPLPTGAATESTLSSIDTATTATATNTGTTVSNTNTIAGGYAAEAAALGSGVLIQGDDGTDRKNINVDPTTGDVQVDVTNTVTVDGSGVTQPVSAASLPLPTGAATETTLATVETNTDFGAVTGGGVEASALRVTLANDSTGVLSIDDNNGSITVDGTVTANAGTGTWTVDLGANNDVTVTGGNAHDGTTLGNPVLGGARATNSIEGITQVGNADLTYLQADLNGVLISRPHTTLEEITSERVSIATTTSTAFTNFPLGGTGIHNYITTISVYNSSATDVYVDFRDGTTGSIIFTVAAPAAGGSVVNLPVPLKGAANTALAYQLSAAATTVYISVVGFQAKG